MEIVLRLYREHCEFELHWDCKHAITDLAHWIAELLLVQGEVREALTMRSFEGQAPSAHCQLPWATTDWSTETQLCWKEICTTHSALYTVQHKGSLAGKQVKAHYPDHMYMHPDIWLYVDDVRES